MKFKTRVHEGIFLKRYKRFFADVKLGEETVVAHVANTGSLKSAAEAGSLCLLTEAENPERKLKYTLEAIQTPGGAWVGVNTSWPNQLVKEAFETKAFSHWKDFDLFKGEVKLSAETRLDLVLSSSRHDKKHFVEVKNVTMASGELAVQKGNAHFPDAVTERGQKHLRELMKLVSEGHSAEIFFTVQRNDCHVFSPADEIDPIYGQLLREAVKAGVRVTAAQVEISKQGLFLNGRTLELNLS
ncbi:MAG: DNA/RNA nuclease SfsA [Pseudobdellovibrionaceae bacterium]